MPGRSHVAPGDERAVVAEDDPTQDVQRRVHPHQPVASLPIQLDPHGVRHLRQLSVAAELVPDDASALRAEITGQWPSARRVSSPSSQG